MLKKRLFGVMAVLVVLMLAIGLAACGGDSDGNGTGGGDGGGSNNGGGGGKDIPSDYTSGWPSDNTLAKYGLSGLTKAPGAGNSWYGTDRDEDGVEVIAVIFETSSDPTSFYRNWFKSKGYTEYAINATSYGFYIESTGAVGTCYYDKSEGMGHVSGGIGMF